jgi:acetyl esterase/lipase
MTLRQDVDVARLHATIATLGRTLGTDIRDTTRALYEPLHPAEPPQRIVRDLAYGPHPRNVLDLHLPAGESTSPLPVLVFVHGGGFVAGDKGGPGQALHDNIGRFAVQHGLIGATINYRFAPEFKFPSGGEDVASAVAFLASHVASYGGDPTRIVAMGHSAGAAHVATCVATPTIAARATGLCGAVLSSGIYDPTALWGAVSTEYYGDDAKAWSQMASRPGLVASEIPFMLLVAEFDPPDFHRQAVLIAADFVEQHQQLPLLVRGEGHNHFSSPAHYGSVDNAFSSEVARFITSITS